MRESPHTGLVLAWHYPAFRHIHHDPATEIEHAIVGRCRDIVAFENPIDVTADRLQIIGPRQIADQIGRNRTEETDTVMFGHGQVRDEVLIDWRHVVVPWLPFGRCLAEMHQ